MPRFVRLWTSAGPGEGRGHLARSLALAEADWPDDILIELAVERGEPSPAEEGRARAAAADRQARRAAHRWRRGRRRRPDPTALAGGLGPARLTVFDDAEAFDGEAALIVQPSLPVWSGHARSGRVLAGYGYAPIGFAWRAASEQPSRTVDGGAPRLVVCFGGSDPHDVTGRLGPALAADPRWSTSVVVGPDYRVAQILAGGIIREPADLPSRITAARLVVIGAGTMKFEVAALGRPAVLLAVADDQRFPSVHRSRRPVPPTGSATDVDPGVVRDAVAGLLDDERTLDAMATAARDVVDGHGADRLAAEIAALARPS